MTIALDAFTSGGAPDTDPSWTHVVSGTPRAAIVVAFYTTFDDIGWTYGGTAMVNVGTFDNSVGGELAFSRLGIWLLDDVSSGNQTVAMTGDTSQVKIAASYTVTAGGEVEFIDSDNVESTGTDDPTMTLTLGGRTSWCVEVFADGEPAIANITPLTNWTDDFEFDAGETVVGMYSYDTIAATDVTAGWLNLDDDVCGLCAAFSELVVAGGNPKGVFGMPLNGPFSGPIG